MKISRLSLQNVKSFKNDVFEFDQSFNIIVGPNASGKSNLLDIISFVLRKYFLVRHIFAKVPLQITNAQEVSPYDNRLLDKFNNTSEDSLIEISLVIKQEDIHNIAMVQSITPDFVDWFRQNVQNGLNPDILLSIKWDHVVLSPEDVLYYRIVNGRLEKSVNFSFELPVEHTINEVEEVYNFKKQMFLAYLYLSDYYSFYLTENDRAPLNPSFLFMGPYRTTTGPNDNQSILSSVDFNQQLMDVSKTDSKTPFSLLGLATTYFARKYMTMVHGAKSSGYLSSWDADSEVMMVLKYLSILRYNWEMDCVNRDNNTFEIVLIKDGDKVRLNQASSGEKEIINYILGIFALKIANGIISIDEPELHLHTRWQLLLLDLFKELAVETGNQFFITTHSPVFIQNDILPNLIRIYKHQKESRHVSLSEKIDTEIKEHLHIINTTNNEKIFFSDLVILVEGITDRLVFQKLVNDVLKRYNKLVVIEVVDVGGKHSNVKYRKFLDKFRIPNYFIADLDYVAQIPGKPLQDLFVINNGKLDRFVFKNESSRDKLALIDILDQAISQNNLDDLSDFRDYLKSTKQKLKEVLSDEEKARIETLVLKQREYGIYILSEGDIEKYLPIYFKAKDLTNIIELLKESAFLSWQTEEGYQKLEKIVEDILSDSGILA
jgi:putative ATP-dependent endonuclease of OLD family